MAEKIYTSTGEEYYPGATYKFTDKNGNTFYSKGDNGYVWQSMTQGIPISVNQNGDWYTEPYLESDGKKVTAHIPDWFKATKEYDDWSQVSAQIPNLTLTKDRLSEMNDYLKALGSQGATRVSLKNDIASYGVKTPELQDRYYNWMMELGQEGRDGTKAKLEGLFEGDTSISDVAKMFKDMSKEQLSENVSYLLDVAKQGREGTWKGSEGEMLYSVALMKILNYVDDNYKNFGDKKIGENDEFQGLLEASTWQKLQAGSTSMMQTLAENFPIINLATRGVYGIGEVLHGRPLSFKIEEGRERVLDTPRVGGGLEGREAAMQVGDVTGSIGNMAATMTASIYFGSVLNGGTVAAAPGGFLSKVGDFARTIPGSMVTDFIINDIPIDLTFFATDWMRTGEVGKAWYNEQEEQPLFGIPIIGHFGPQVPGGLAMNLLGDAILDVSLPLLSTLGSTAYKKLDTWTSGGITRAREAVAIQNMKLQQTLSNMPVLGTGWQKFINYMMGAENANFIREARKSSIIAGSTEPYIRAQNLLTLFNHAGLTDIAPLYRLLDTDLEISSTLKKFMKEAKKYGGVEATEVKWKEVHAGVEKLFKKVVPDVMPRDVKDVLRKTERLSELRGEKAAEGGLPFNPARDTEIEKLEADLEKAPKELKDFADKFSQFNKGIEQIGVNLGLKKQEWLDALNEDPRWQAYMTRQALTPGGEGTASAGGSVDPTEAAILNKSRKGYYADNYLDPMLSLSMKVEAMGRAYAWNERAKALVDFEVIQGKIVAGKGSVEAANRLEEVKAEIKAGVDLREKIGYDFELSSYRGDMTTVKNAFTKINDLLNLPGTINLKSIYDAKQNPRITSFIDDFEKGKVQFAEGVKENAGLSDSAAASIIRNTYSYQGNKIVDESVEAKPAAKPTDGDGIISDTISEEKAAKVELDYSAGVTDDGVPYRYTVENGEITSFEPITDSEGMSAAVANITGAFNLSPDTVDRIGIPNSQAIIRTVLFYRDNVPMLGDAQTSFRLGRGSTSWGWIPGAGSIEYGWKVVDGKVVADQYPVYMGPQYRKGNEENLLRKKRAESASGFKPKNTGTAESTPTHENGHSLIVKIAQERINRKLADGELSVEAVSLDPGGYIDDEYYTVQEELMDRAMKKMGYDDYLEEDITRQAMTISEYASSLPYARRPNGKEDRSEVFSEAMRMYQGNGDDSSKFCLAIVEEMRQEAGRFSVAATPEVVMKKNGLNAPNGLFKNGQYAFPSNVRGDKSRAAWLDKQRQNNPYVKGKGLMTEEEYRKANLWDTFFQKEIRAYDPGSKSSMPKALVKKNGDFIEDMAKNSAKKMVDEIRKSSIDGFSEELATMALSRNSNDIYDAMESFLVQRVNQAAEKLADKMDGDRAENINKARATLWSEDILKNESIDMLSSLIPDGDVKDIQSFVDNLFDVQAKGFAAADLLPVEIKKLQAEQEKLQAQISKNNNYTKEKSAAADKARKGYVGDVTQMIHYKQGGEDVYVMVKDPVVASILKRPTDFKTHGVMSESLAQLSNFVSRMYRLGTTGVSPLSLVRNVLRDPMQATIQGGFNPLNMTLSPDVFYHTLRNYGLDDNTISAVTTKLRNWAGASALTNEMKNMGYTTPSKVGYRNATERLSKELTNPRTKGGKIVNKIIETAEAPLEAWETMFRNQVAQQSFVKNFERTRDVNKAMGAAMFDTSNSTTNFSHAIGVFKRATSTVPYLSSAINGTRSFWVQFNADPVGMVSRITAGFMVPAMAITAWNLADEDRRQRYVNLPEWYRDGHIVLLDLDGNAFAFPIPEELQQFYGTARRFIEYTQDVNKQGIPSILAQGAFGFMPASVDGYFKDDGSIDWDRGTAQMLSGLMPQAVTAIYEVWKEEDLFTGQDLSSYDDLNKTINTLSNIFGTGIKNWANDIGMMAGTPSSRLVGKSTLDTLARDLFGLGFDDATNQFMNMIGSPSEVDSETGKEKPATGLFKENETLKKRIEDLDKSIATASDEERPKLEEEKQKLIDDFTSRVGNLVHNYMNLYTVTGGLEDWQKAKIVSILTLGGAYSSADSESYQYQDMSEAFLDERGLAQQRYLQAGLPGGASQESVMQGNDSIAVQAALNRFYGVPRQAAADFTNALKATKLKDIRSEFYDAISKIYDIADETNTKPDYDMIEKVQARYLQAVDGVLIPIINQYGINVLNNNDFINEVRSYVNGMIPSNDWSKSVRNAKKFLSKKDFPMATVDVKKWLIDRYSSSIRNRNIASDAEVTKQLDAIKKDIDAGRSGAAKGKINALFNGIQKANYYISSQDIQILNQLNNMLK